MAKRNRRRVSAPLSSYAAASGSKAKTVDVVSSMHEDEDTRGTRRAPAPVPKTVRSSEKPAPARRDAGKQRAVSLPAFGEKKAAPTNTAVMARKSAPESQSMLGGGSALLRQAAPKAKSGISFGAGGVAMPTLTELGRNSLAWHKTTDPARRRELENKNMALRAESGLLFDPVGGRTFDKTGTVNLSAPMDIAFGGAQVREQGKNTLRAVMPKNKSALLPQSPAEGAGEMLGFEAKREQEKEKLTQQYTELQAQARYAKGIKRLRLNNQMSALEKRYDEVIGANGGLRFAAAASSIVKTVTGAGAALAETLHQRGVNEAKNVENAQLTALREQAAALDLELQNYLQSGAGMYEVSPEMRTKQQELAELRRRIDAAEDKTPANQNKFGQRMMRDAADAAQFATDMPNKGKQFLANTGLSIAQNAALLPAAVISPAIPLALMGVQAAAQKSTELNAKGEEPGAALLRGIAAGGVEALTEKIPLESVLSLIKTGGKGALRNLLKQAGMEATEEGLSYAANYVSDVVAHDPDAAFSLKELGAQMLSGGLSGLVMGGGGTALGYMGKGNAVRVDTGAAAAQGALTETNAQTDAQTAQGAPKAAPVPARMEMTFGDGGKAAERGLSNVPESGTMTLKHGQTEGVAQDGTGQELDFDRGRKRLSEVDFEGQVGAGTADVQGAARYSVENREDAGGSEPIQAEDREGGRLTLDQQERLSGTAIAEDDGRAIPVYHGTQNMEFDTFAKGDTGFHFGSQAQAQERLGDRAGRVIRAYLNVQRPYQVQNDIMNWKPNALAMRMEADGVLTDVEANEIYDLVQQGFGYDSPASIRLREILAENGYDGIVYPNAFEGEGISYMAFYPEQVVISDDGRGGAAVAPETMVPAQTSKTQVPRMEMTFGDSGKAAVAAPEADRSTEGSAEKRAALEHIRTVGMAEHAPAFTPPDGIHEGDYVLADDRGNYGVVVGRTQEGDFRVRFINQETHATDTATIAQDRVQRVMEADEYKTASQEEVTAAQEEALGYDEERMNALLKKIEQRWGRVTVPYSAVPLLRVQMEDAANKAERASAKKEPKAAKHLASLTAVEHPSTKMWAQFAADVYNANQAQRIFLQDLERRWQLSEVDIIDAREMAAGREATRSVLQLPQGKYDVIREYASALHTYNESVEEAYYFQSRIRAKRIGNVKDAIDGSGNWKDSGALRHTVSTPERVLRHVCGEDADAMIDEFITPVHRHEAESVRWQKAMRDRLRDITKSTTKEESVLAHMQNRLRENPTDSAMQVACADYAKEHAAKIDAGRVKKLEKQLTELTEQMFPDISEAQIINGMEPLEFRRNYIPSLQTINEGNAIHKLLRKLGIETKADELPTEIAGKTEDFRPGKKYAQFRNARTGLTTAFDAVEAVDNYISAAAHAIYHTGDIQNLRILEEQLRMQTADEASRGEYLAAKNNATFTMGDKNQVVSEFFQKQMGNLPHLPTWIGEYTNLLAGKKAKADRVIEDFFTGRSVYRSVNDIESKVAANMVGFNINSALTNIIPLTQGGAELRKSSMLRAMLEYGKDTLGGHNTYADASDFLTNRAGAGRVSETTMDKVKNAAFLPMSAVDDFSSGVLHRARVMDNMEQRNMSRAAAVAEADAWCGGVMADRSIGAMPIAFSIKNPVVRMFSMFQLEVANQYGYAFEDVPLHAREKGIAAVAGVLLQIALGAFLYNDAKEELTGSRSATDPIDMLNGFIGDLSGYALPNTFDALAQLMHGELDAEDFKTEKQGVSDAFVGIGKEFAEEVPFIGGVMGGGRIPISSAIPSLGTLVDAATNGDKAPKKRLEMAGKELAKPLMYLLPPAGGGQLKKAIEGFGNVRAGGSFSLDNEGRAELQFPAFGQSPADYAKAMAFGKYASREAQDYVDSGFKTLGTEYTAAYQSMLRDYGVDRKTAYDAIRAIAGAEPTKDADGKTVQPKRTVQQELLFAAEGLTAEQKHALDWKLITKDSKAQPAQYEDRNSFQLSVYVPENRQRVAREAMESGASVDDFARYDEAVRVAQRPKNVSESEGRETVLAQILGDAALSDGEKNVLIDKVLISGLSDSRKKDWENTYKGKLMPAQFVQISDKYGEITEAYKEYQKKPGDSSVASMKATEFAQYVDTLGLTPIVSAAVKGDFSYFNMFPADAIPYEWDMLSSGDEKKAAAKLEASGLDIDIYNQTKQHCWTLKADKDANGKSISGSKKAKVVSYVRSVEGLTQEQQNLMLQAMGYTVAGTGGKERTSGKSSGNGSAPAKKMKGFKGLKGLNISFGR